MKYFLIECIGTFFLVFAILFTANPLAIGLTLAAMIYVAGHVSGGHFNPAVSLAVWLRGKLSSVKLLMYMLAQILGAFIAAWLYFIIINKSAYPAPATGLAAWKSIIIEGLGTFLLCSVVLAVATTKKLQGNYVYGLIIGLTLGAMVFVGGSLTGGAFNPAVGTGPILFDFIKGGPSIKVLYIYLVGPFCGSILAAIIYRIINSEEFSS